MNHLREFLFWDEEGGASHNQTAGNDIVVSRMHKLMCDRHAELLLGQ